MKTVILALLACFSLQAIEGTYTVKGYDPYQKVSYTGTAVITPDQNGVYQVTWSLPGLQPPEYSGTGLKVGDYVCFAYESGSPRASGEIGLQTYKIEKNKLKGSFVYLGKNLVGTEELTKK